MSLSGVIGELVTESEVQLGLQTPSLIVYCSTLPNQPPRLLLSTSTAGPKKGVRGQFLEGQEAWLTQLMRRPSPWPHMPSPGPAPWPHSSSLQPSLQSKALLSHSVINTCDKEGGQGLPTRDLRKLWKRRKCSQS